MQAFLTEDDITDIFSDFLISKGWDISSRAKGNIRGADIIAKKENNTICIEAKGSGSQTLGSRRYGQPFTRLQCQHHTDAAFTALSRMITRYKPTFVGLVLPDDKYHEESLLEVMHAIKKLDYGAWLVSPNKEIRVLNEPIDFNI